MARRSKRRKMSALQKKYFGKRKHKAKRRRARRSNPVRVLLANPRRRKHRRTMRANPRRKRHRVMRVNPRRRRHRHVLRANPRRHKNWGVVRRHKRRTNPGRFRLSSLKSLAKMAFFGGVGVLSARTGSFLYNKYLASEVSKLNEILSDVARLAAMAGMTLGVEYGLKKAVRLTPANCLAIKIGGLGETGRQAIGMVVGKALPSFQRGTVGLDGVTVPYGYYDASVLGNADQVDGLEPAEMFDGLVDASMFDGVGRTNTQVGPGMGYGYRSASGDAYGD